MRQPVARVFDTSDHGGSIISGSPTTFADGKPVARTGDSHACPIPGHGVTPVVGSTIACFIDGNGVVRVGDTTGCGATITSGSPTLSAG